MNIKGLITYTTGTSVVVGLMEPAGAVGHEIRLVSADAIVIERSELPEVVPARGRDFAIDGTVVASANNAEYAEERARVYLAIATHLREHPPVPEPSQRDVDFLTGRLVDASAPAWRPSEIAVVARRLLATGRVHVDTEGADRG